VVAYPPIEGERSTQLFFFFCSIVMKRLFLFLSILLTLVSEGKYFSTVIIDPGHGGRDKGAYWGGVRESYLNLIVSHKLSYELKRRGIRVVMVRKRDRFLSKHYRVRLANRYPSAVFVSVHFNASLYTRAKGIETFYYSSEGRKLASKVQSRMVRQLKGRNRGVKRGNYQVLRESRPTAILVECGFISNSRERARCLTRWYQTSAASAIARGLMDYRKMR